jgi:hypothetical protein
MMVCLSLLAALLPLGCAGPDTRTPSAVGSIDQLRDAWVNRNGTIGTNVTIRVWRYSVDAATASFSFDLNENDLRNPCDAADHYRLAIERLISSSITPVICPSDRPVWELVIDTSK